MKIIMSINIILLLLFSHPLFGQNTRNIKISGNYNDELLLNILAEFKNKYGCNFYYINQQVEDIKVSADIKNQSIEKAIGSILSKTDLKYFVNPEGGFVIYESKVQQDTFTGKKYRLSGVIIDSTSKETLPYVNVYIEEIEKGNISDSLGNYKISDIPEGKYTIRFSFIGYIPVEYIINLNSDRELNICLAENIFELKEVVITPGIYEIYSSDYSARILSKKEIVYSPNVGKDLTRTFRALPGLANNDYSAKPRIRGGNADENAYYLDNFEISEPFHFEEFDGLFSIINTDYINSIKVMPGGFPVKYSDKLSGIIDIKTPDYVSNNKVNLSLDLLNLTLYIKRNLSDKTNIQLSVRRTYLDFILSNVDNEIAFKPVSYDIWAKINHTLNSKNQLSFNFLLAYDIGKAELREALYNWVNLDGTKINYYGWINWRNKKNENIDFLTTLGYQKLSRRTDFAFHNSISTGNQDNRITDILSIKNSSRYNFSNKLHFEFGGETRFSRTFYEFNEIRYNQFESSADHIIIDTIDVNTHLYDNHTALYIQNTYVISDQFSIMGGLRFSYFSYLKKPLLAAPRAAVSYNPTKRLNIMLGYGIYNQADNIKKIKIYEGQDHPANGYNQSSHYLGSITYAFKKSDVLLNIYYKNNNKLSDDYNYDIYNRIGGAVSILDQAFTSVSGYSKGIEITCRQKYGRSTLSASYIYAVNKIKNTYGEEAWRDNDRRHTVILNNLLNLKNNWSIGVYFLYYSGEPYSPTNVAFIGESSDGVKKMLFYDIGRKNTERLPNFSSFDLKVDKVFYFKKWGLNIYLNIINLFSHENIRNYYWYPYENPRGDVMTILDEEEYISKIFISPGIGISF